MKKRWKRSLGLMLCLMSLCSALPVSAEDNQVQISDKEYLINLQNSDPIFISNEKAVSGEVGSQVFFTYTVDEVASDQSLQHGVVGAVDNTASYPYVKNGTMHFTSEQVLLEEGCTYVFKFERTSEGFYYEAAKLKGEKAVPIYFTRTVTDGATDAYNHYGIWFAAGGVTALLNHVRCYDEKGNDLGIHFNTATAVIQNEMNELISKHHVVDASYDFTLEEANTIAISSKYPTNSDVIYMEYEVDDVKVDNTYHQGVIVTRAPLATYPYDKANGLMLFKMYKDGENINKGDNQLLLMEGAKYFIVFVKKADTYEVIVQRTYKGKTEMLSFPTKVGSYEHSFPYVSLWLGEGPKNYFSASFKNFKIYDGDGKSLGVQLRDTGVQLNYEGELEDYSKSKAAYYCKEDNSFIILKDDKKVGMHQGTVEEEGTYRIQNNDELYIVINGGKKIYNYNAMLITDENGKEYVRMNPAKVTFVTGEETTVVDVDASTGYRVERPQDPKSKGNTFKGWCLADGTNFDFETVITESITLYAKWQDEDGREYLAVDQLEINSNSLKVIAIVATAIILLGCGAGCIAMAKRRKQK